MGELAGLITGAASGIGEATARRLLRDGVRRQVLVDVAGEALERTAEALRAEGAEVLARVHDVADPAAWAETEAATRERFGGLDRVVANAGITDSGSVAEMPFEAWRRVLSVNLDGVFLTLQAGMRLLKDGGSAVVVSSAAALKATPGIAAYGASKAAVVQLAKVAAVEGASRRVRVNALLPGGVETPIWRVLPFWNELLAEAGGVEGAAFDRLASFATPLGRYAKAEEVADQIAWLLSDASGMITGAALVMDGGYTL
jgi:2-keto-3-deoxy-L-fuconate dehydrogenase